MSYRFIYTIWDIRSDQHCPHSLSPAEKSILVRLASFGNENGHNIYPGVALLAKSTGYTDRYVRVVLAELTERNIIIKVPQFKGNIQSSNLYILNSQRLEEMKEYAVSLNKPATVTALHPEPEVTPPDPGSPPPCRTISPPPDPGSPKHRSLTYKEQQQGPSASVVVLKLIELGVSEKIAVQKGKEFESPSKQKELAIIAEEMERQINHIKKPDAWIISACRRGYRSSHPKEQRKGCHPTIRSVEETLPTIDVSLDAEMRAKSKIAMELQRLARKIQLKA